MDMRRVSGAVFGAAVGDALGASFEGHMGDDTRRLSMMGGGQFSLAPGEVTDDTLMMLDLFETYAECGSFVRRRFLEKMCETVRREPKTFGRTTKMLSALVGQGCYPKSSARVTDLLFGSRTNGSVMRTLPVGLTAASCAEAERTARRVSSFTHTAFEAQEACAAVSSAVFLLAAGCSKQEVLANVPQKYLEGELIPSVDALEATRCAFCVFRDGDEYTDVVTRACRLGGDTDTIAAIAGGMAGALYGIESVPEKWRDMLNVKERIERVLRDTRRLPSSSPG